MNQSDDNTANQAAAADSQQNSQNEDMKQIE